jgi:glycosyltransferase involved in cell wall biosynthesis
MDVSDLKVLVVGPSPDQLTLHKLENQYPDELKNRVFFAGWVSQLEISVLLRDALFTIVLYETTDPNNRYCEPNRFFNALNLGIPVISGNNEPMAEILKYTKAGIVLDSDGRDPEELGKAIINMKGNLNFFRKNCLTAVGQFIWKDEMIPDKWYRKFESHKNIIRT